MANVFDSIPADGGSEWSDALGPNGVPRITISAGNKNVFDDIPAKAESQRKGSGVGSNLAAGLNSAAYQALTLPFDLAAGAQNLLTHGINAVAGTNIGDAVPASTLLGRGLGYIHPALNPENTVAETPSEKIARSMGEGAGLMVFPEGAIGALGKVAPDAAAKASALFGKTDSLPDIIGNAVVGAGAGAGSSIGQQAVPDSFKPTAGIVGGMLGGGLTAAGVAAVPAAYQTAKAGIKNYIEPFTNAGQNDIAAKKLRSAASDLSSSQDALDNPSQLVPGSQPTTFQQTGDMGLGSLEREVQTKYPADFMQRRADQNAARVDALNNVQAAGSPEQVVNAVQQHLNRINAITQGVADRASGQAQQATAALGGGQLPEVAGATIRGSLQGARDVAKEQERALWRAVDPTGTLALPAANTKATAARIGQNMPVSAAPLAPEEAAVHSLVARYGDNVPLREMQALQSRLTTAMRAERVANGQSPAYNRMSDLNSAIHSDLMGAVAQKAAQEQQAVAAGQIAPEQTMAANIQRQVDAWRDVRNSQAGGAFAQGAGVSSAPRTAFVRSGPGGQGQSGGGFPNSPSDPRLSADAANFDQAALDRLRQARDATKQRAEVYDNKTLTPLLRRPGTTYPYELANSGVPAKVFVSGPKGFDTVQTYIRAARDPNAIQAIQDYAIGQLRKDAIGQDGVINPAKVAAFRTRYSDALRAFPQLDASLGNAQSAAEVMANVASRQKEIIDEAQKGIIGKLVGKDNPTDIANTVGGMFSRQDSVAQFGQLRRAIGSNPDAQDGLRKAIVDYAKGKLIGNTEAGTSGVGSIKSDTFQNFVKTNSSALRAAGFSDEQLKTWQSIADDLQRANRSLASVKIPGQSNTGQDSQTFLRRLISMAGSQAGGAVEGSAVGATIAGSIVPVYGHIAGAAGGAWLGKTVAAARLSGLDTVDKIIADAMLNPERAKLLLSRVTPKNEIGLDAIGARLYRRAVRNSLVTADQATH